MYDLYEVRAKTRSHHCWKLLARRRCKWVEKAEKPKWWQFWKPSSEPAEPDDLEYLNRFFETAVNDPQYVEVEYVGYVAISEQCGDYLHPVILREYRKSINALLDDDWQPPSQPR